MPIFIAALCGMVMSPKKLSLTTLSNEALCTLRDEIAVLLNSRAEDLRRELNRLAPTAQRKKASPKYRSPNGETWSGRGKKPRWLTGSLKEGKKVEDFLIVAQNGASL